MNHQFKKSPNDSSFRLRRESSRQTFPPFRITLQDVNRYPSTELSIIKEINKHCKLNLTYGRYTKTSDNQTQWSAQAFGNELKQHYSSVVCAVRLFVNGGRPLSKVRVDFSSYKELSTILKSKRILLDDENTAFAVEPYVPPTRILRCYNCQVYDDHIAAHCPNKNNPVCFRCSQNQPYNPNCDNIIKCAHCQGDHMAGNPSCPVKLGKRQEKHQQLKISHVTSTSTAQQQHKQIWSDNTKECLFGVETAALNATSTTVNNKKQ
ncbi:unnamed protein product [Rotaria sordida]|uniref:Gag-like protein n=1 Tax=Rotaria sordida TaxID=392033 RepID=A0A819Z4Q1_9BILA|nr:unnamed protein product [Rotaria sordida]CAF4168556.1 unnamed protein product [Rotaria sordida]